MLKLAIIFGLISIVSGAFGFSTLAGTSASIAKVIFGIFLLLLVLAITAIVLGFSIAF